MKIENKRRFISFLIVCFMILSFTTSLVTGKEETVFSEYIVKENQTLWNIAQEVKTESEDIRERIAEIKEDNNIDSVIYEGQILQIRKNPNQ